MKCISLFFIHGKYLLEQPTLRICLDSSNVPIVQKHIDHERQKGLCTQPIFSSTCSFFKKKKKKSHTLLCLLGKFMDHKCGTS